jgi:antitoxin (DNA-binding transcriptional repressor) of toxin-antitoxin stability system
MIRLNIHQAKTHLSKYLARLKEGDTIVLCKRNVPIAEIRKINQPAKNKRSIGLFKGQIRIPKGFFEPLPDEILDSFEGKFGR